MENVFEAVMNFLRAKPEVIVTTIGFLLAVFTLVLNSRKDRALQLRQSYRDLEFEASRIFQVCVQNPAIALYLRGPSEADKEPYIEEKTYWYVCQCLNAFEIIISLRKEGAVANDLFATWISWFHELGTAPRFAKYWDSLWSHYKPDLQRIMKAADDARKRRSTDVDGNPKEYERELEAFHKDVAEALGEPEILDHLRRSKEIRAGS